MSVEGRTITLLPPARLRFNDGEAMVEAARLGLGIAQLPHYMVDEEIEKGRLVELLRKHRPPASPIHAVIPANRLVPARVRLFLDALYALGTEPAVDAPARRRAVRKPGPSTPAA